MRLFRRLRCWLGWHAWLRSPAVYEDHPYDYGVCRRCLATRTWP